LAGSTLYGTTYEGLGSSSNGTIFAINTDGTGYTNLYSFGSVANDGAYPQAGLTLAGSTLYGTTYGGGSLGIGTIFAINTNGSGYTVLASCAGLSADGGAYPNGLTLVGSMLYGTTSCGGSSGYGTVFELTTNTVQVARSAAAAFTRLAPMCRLWRPPTPVGRSPAGATAALKRTPSRCRRVHHTLANRSPGMDADCHKRRHCGNYYFYGYWSRKLSRSVLSSESAVATPMTGRFF
jgi:uncharacterized repeat protein (TIGR03803 family)